MEDILVRPNSVVRIIGILATAGGLAVGLVFKFMYALDDDDIEEVVGDIDAILERV